MDLRRRKGTKEQQGWIRRKIGESRKKELRRYSEYGKTIGMQRKG